jgi:hypothetical protein
MLADPSQVIVEDGLCVRCFIPSKQAHHCCYPEIRAEGGSIADCATRLASRLSNYRVGVESGWHRRAIGVAIDDVAEFLRLLDRAEQDERSPCRCGALDQGASAAARPGHQAHRSPSLPMGINLAL